MRWGGSEINCRGRWSGSCSRGGCLGWQRLANYGNRRGWRGGSSGCGLGEPILCFGSPPAAAGRGLLTQVKIVKSGGTPSQSGRVAGCQWGERRSWFGGARGGSGRRLLYWWRSPGQSSHLSAIEALEEAETGGREAGGPVREEGEAQQPEQELDGVGEEDATNLV